MTSQYFAFIDGEQRGPFPLDRLTEAGLRPSTYVWCKGMADWQRADSVDEIRSLFRRHIETRKEPVRPTPEEIRPNQGNNGPFPRQEGGESADNPPQMRFPLPPTEENVDINRPPQVSMVLAILSLIICFLPTGIAAVFFTYKATKTWDESNRPETGVEQREELRRRCHDYERLSKMWLGLTLAFGIIFWTLVFSIPKG